MHADVYLLKRVVVQMNPLLQSAFIRVHLRFPS